MIQSVTLYSDRSNGMSRDDRAITAMLCRSRVGFTTTDTSKLQFAKTFANILSARGLSVPCIVDADTDHAIMRDYFTATDALIHA